MSAGDALVNRLTKRLADLGLETQRPGPRPFLKQTKSLDEYRRWLDFPTRADAPASDVTASAITSMPEEELEQAIVQHVSNERVISDPAVIQAIEQRRGSGFEVQVVTTDGGDLVVDGEQYVISGTSAITAFDTVTLQNGGSILIETLCNFSCNTLKKIPGGTSQYAYDVFCYGAPGAAGEDGEDAKPDPPDQAADGKDAKCGWGGGYVERKAGDGSAGTDGGDGGDADAGQNGGEGTITFTVYNTLDATSLTFVHRGGSGGNGGNGGKGAKGGEGGDGGDGKKCGADNATGGHGGKGGDGGNGGNGARGGNGGRGGTLTITVPSGKESVILATNEAAPGGSGGKGGDKGLGGDGGKGGSNGGGNGTSGDPGDYSGNDGDDGDEGTSGTIVLNGAYIY